MFKKQKLILVTLLLSLALFSCSGGGGGSAAPAGPLQVTTFSDIAAPWGIAFDSAGNIYATSTANYLYRIAEDGVPSSLIGGNPPFYLPRDIIFDDDDNAYIANDLNHTILKIESPYTSSSVSVYAGQTGTSGNTNSATPLDARFHRPYGMARFGNILYIADSGNGLIRKIDLSTGVVSNFADAYTVVYDVAVDNDGNVYECSALSNTIYKYNSAGAPIDAYSLANNPHEPQIYSIAITSSGNILAADYNNHIIWQITPAGVASVFAGTPGTSGLINGDLLDAQFQAPSGIAIASDGAIYIADAGNSVIRKISN